MPVDNPRSSGDGRQKEFSDQTGLFCDPDSEEGASKTRQSELESTDINKIVDRFARAGLPLPTGEGRFLDLSEVPDFRDALHQVARANEYFMTLDAKARALFENDPAKFLDVVNDPAQLSLLVEAGVIPKGEVKRVEDPQVVAAAERAVVKAERKRAREIDRELNREDPDPK